MNDYSPSIEPNFGSFNELASAFLQERSSTSVRWPRKAVSTSNGITNFISHRVHKIHSLHYRCGLTTVSLAGVARPRVALAYGQTTETEAGARAPQQLQNYQTTKLAIMTTYWAISTRVETHRVGGSAGSVHAARMRICRSCASRQVRLLCRGLQVWCSIH